MIIRRLRLSGRLALANAKPQAAYHVLMSAPRLPPSPPLVSWLGGHLNKFRAGRLDFFADTARNYGDIVKLRFGHRRVYLVSDPRLIEEVVVAKNHNFIKHFALRLNPLVLGKGLLTSEGDF